MSRMTFVLSNLAVAALLVGLTGCARSEAPPTQAAPDQSQADNQANEAQLADGANAPSEEANKYEKALAQLSEADRALAEKQEVCPVSGEPLGSMGKPIKVTANGRDVFLCCSGCEAEFKANPDKYLAKLNP